MSKAFSRKAFLRGLIAAPFATAGIKKVIADIKDETDILIPARQVGILPARAPKLEEFKPELDLIEEAIQTPHRFDWDNDNILQLSIPCRDVRRQVQNPFQLVVEYLNRRGEKYEVSYDYGHDSMRQIAHCHTLLVDRFQKGVVIQRAYIKQVYFGGSHWLDKRPNSKEVFDAGEKWFPITINESPLEIGQGIVV